MAQNIKKDVYLAPIKIYVQNEMEVRVRNYFEGYKIGG